MQVYRQAYTTELLNERSFGGPLQPLKKNAVTVWESVVSTHTLEALSESKPTTWPEQFMGGALAKRSENVGNAIRLAKLRNLNKVPIKAIVERYIGSSKSPEFPEASSETIGFTRL